MNELIGVWDNVDDINWFELPDQFAMKCTHGCGYNIICDSKANLNIKQSKRKLKEWMKEDYGKLYAELHYSKIAPKIVCEKYLVEDPIDYKFFCFNGEPQFMYVSQEFGKDVNLRITFFEMDGRIAPYKRLDYPVLETASVPLGFEKMVQMSRDLSIGFPFVRVDWYEIDGRIYFGELTFTPSGGMMSIEPSKYDWEWGELLHIEGLMERLGLRN